MDDNTYECPRCSSKIYPEMTRCPQCGLNLFPEDEETNPDISQVGETGWPATLGSLVIGLMIAAGIAFIIHFIIASISSPAMLSKTGASILYLAGPVGAFVGAFVCASMAKHHPLLLGGLVGLVSIFTSTIMATHWVEVTPSFLAQPLNLGVGLTSLIAGLCGGWLSRGLAQGSGWKEKWNMLGRENLLYRELLRRVRFNGSIADRLIEYERKQEPNSNRLQHIQNAIERWERDNR